MALDAREKRARFWPGMFAVLGTLNLFDYFYEFAFEPDDVLRGIGFLLVVPQAYVRSESFSFSLRHDESKMPTILDWLAVVGFALVITGFVTEWRLR